MENSGEPLRNTVATRTIPQSKEEKESVFSAIGAYIVQPNDNLGELAIKFGISEPTLIWLNDLLHGQFIPGSVSHAEMKMGEEVTNLNSLLLYQVCYIPKACLVDAR
jgi:hypothetical protein